MRAATACFLVATMPAAAGCATLQDKVNAACGYIAIVDDKTAAAFEAADGFEVPDEYVDRYMVPIGEIVVEAHDWCYEDPGVTE